MYLGLERTSRIEEQVHLPTVRVFAVATGAGYRSRSAFNWSAIA
ncbi:hypothetical protein [Actinomadura sp. 7K534]|nr:hypothetical protein [Actinomadura sp. 7K534]